MLTDDAILKELREAGALLEGHFILSSGFHSNAYLQCARLLMDPRARRKALRIPCRKNQSGRDRRRSRRFSGNGRGHRGI